MGLCNSLAQIALLAGLGGGICHCINAVSAQRDSQKSGVAISCPDDSIFRPTVVTTQKEDEEYTSPLAALVQEYYGPRSMLTEVIENIESVSSESAPSAMTSGAASATASTGTSALTSVATSAAEPSSNKQHIIISLLLIV